MKYIGRDDKGQRMQVLELPAHKYFVATQYHPDTSQVSQVSPPAALSSAATRLEFADLASDYPGSPQAADVSPGTSQSVEAVRVATTGTHSTSSPASSVRSEPLAAAPDSLETNIAVARAVWDATICIRLRLADTDRQSLLPQCDGPMQSREFVVSRTSYLPLLTTRVRREWFDLLLPSTSPSIDLFGDADIWYESTADSTPLRWHLHIGLLYDLSNGVSENESSVVWDVTVHLTEFPVLRIIRSPSSLAARDMFMTIMKEADHIRFGSTKRIMNLSKQDQLTLWDSHTTAVPSFDAFWAVNRALIESNPAQTPQQSPASPRSPSVATQSNSVLPRAIPFRLYVVDNALYTGCGGTSSAMSTTGCVQDLIPPAVTIATAQTRWTVVADLLTRLMPNWLSLQQRDSTKRIVVIVNGVVIQPETPLYWLSLNLAHLDGFLHIVIRSQPLV
ncbi:APG5-domain-containing protein [Ramicandelaber brevisporus]|nr:APG5-domain-containing protein [Ramicandelaber brevisporus]